MEAASALSVPAFEMLASFFDLAYAYRFGPPGHHVTSICLTEAVTGAVLAEAFHFPVGRAMPREHLGLMVAPIEQDGRWYLDVSTERFAQSVQIVAEVGRPMDNWFHLRPSSRRRIELVDLGEGRPSGDVCAINGREMLAYSV